MSYTATYSSPFGMIVLESDGEVLTGLRFMESSETQKQAIETLPADTTNTLPIFAEPRLGPQGTAFQKRVWTALFTIWFGQTKTYGEIAQMVGCRSAQAVGQAVGANPIALIIPCHRVIAAHGKIGGYEYGIEIKKRLLELEQL